jgi:hypothetical protein
MRWAPFWALIRAHLTRAFACGILSTFKRSFAMWTIAAGVMLGMIGFAILLGLCVGLLLAWGVRYEDKLARWSRRAKEARETVRAE